MSAADASRAAAPAAVRGALPFAATHLGFQWDGSEDPPEVRTSADGAAWSAWAPVTVSEDMSDPATGRWVSELVPGRGTRHVEVRDPHGRVVTVTDINVEDGPARTVAVRRGAEAATAGPRVVTRQEWGADEGLRKPGRTFNRVQKLFVHHTAGAATADGASDVRAIYAYHTQTNGWDDIGYNFLIDSAGRLYEGRWARDYADGEVHSGEDPGGRGVVGAHVGGLNAGSMGVSLIGNFQGAGPSAQATSTLVEFLAWKADRYGLDPMGAATYVNPSTGHKATFPNIAGHRDADATACPGQELYSRLPDIRSLVEARIAQTSGASAPAMPTATAMHPGTASKDTTPAVSGAVSRTASRVEVVFEGTQASSRRVLPVAPAGGSFSVGDDDYDGVGLAEDRYSVRAVAYDAEGRGSPAAPAADDYVVSLEGLPSGYWVMGRDGGIFSYGSAGFHGSTGDKRLNAPPVGFDAAPDGDGYWLVAGDGGIFNYGSARFLGSTGNIRLARPVVDMASTADGNGYWLVASDGGIFAFGNAPFVGSTGNIRLAQPIVGMAPTATGRGYWLVASDGGIFAFGDAAFLGSLPSIGVTSTAVRMESANDSYYVLTQDGRVRSFGPAPLFGNPASLGVVAKDMAIDW
jgi:hypothetical protein